MTFKKKFLLFILVFTMVYFICLADNDEENEEETEQPLQELFQTESVYPQEKGEVQLTLIGIYNKSSILDYYNFPFVIEYGLTDSWQLEFELNSYKFESTFEFNTVELGTKFSFMNMGGSNIHSAIGLDAEIPLESSEEEDEEEGVEFEPFVILAKDFPGLNHLQLFTELRLGIPENFDDVEFNWNIGMFFPIGNFCLTGEFNYFGIGSEEKQMYFTPGLVWNLPGTWELGIGVPIGLNDEADEIRVIVGLTFEFDI